MKISANGLSMNYELNGSGRSMVLLHGGGDNLNAWYNQVPVFSKKYQVLAYDIRGHGQTELPRGPINTTIWIQDLYALLNTLNIEETILVGHSLGGGIALNFILAHPTMAKALILSNSGLRPSPKSEEEKNQMEAFTKNNIERLKKEGLENDVEGRLKAMFSPGFAEENPDIADRYKSIFLQNRLEGYIRVVEAMGIPDASLDLSGITCPVLVIAGEHDPYVNPAAGESTQEAIPGAHLRILPTGHAPEMECPDEYNETVLDFLAKVGLG
jgi:pimeloyl-ACP methyl ester carboxylesterase